MKQYEHLANKFCKSYKHDSSIFRKIEDLKKYLSPILKIEGESFKRQAQTLRKENNDNFFPLFSSVQNTPLERKLQQQKLQNNRKFISKNHQPNFKHLKTFSNQKEKQKRAVVQLHAEMKNLHTEDAKIKKSTFRKQTSREKPFSVERQIGFKHSDPIQMKINEPNDRTSYQIKEKQINKRKQKLFRIMTLQEKSFLTNERSSIKLNQLTPEPQLFEFQNQILQKSAEGSNQSSEVIKSLMQVDNFQKHDRKDKLLFEQTQIYFKKNKSVNSLIQEVSSPHQESKALENETDQKNKYEMSFLPSSESNSSGTEILSKSSENRILKNPKQDKKKRQKKIDKKIIEFLDFSIQKDKNSDSIQINTKLDEIISNQETIQINTKLDEIISNQEKSARLYLLSLDLKDCDIKIKYLKAALNYCPNNLSSAQLLSGVYISQNKAKQCLDLCNEYLTMLRKNSKKQLEKVFIINKSAALNSLGRFSETIALLETEVKFFQEAKMYKNLGDAYFCIDNKEKCQFYFEKAIKFNEKLDEAVYNLAVCLYSQSNFYNADVWITKALQINSRNLEYQKLKQEIRKRLERND